MNLQAKDKKDFMLESGIKSTGLDNLIKTGYSALGLSTFFTSGPEESRAWTVEKNSKASDAAGVIHTDFKKKFIRAETVSHEDFIRYKGFNECRAAGKLRLEGKDYAVKDGDVIFFRTGA
jgi:ribosome-binding ATPase YchF (GTP1/OBG family)